MSARKGKVQHQMNVLEVTAKSVDEATKTAATKLGVTPDQLSVTVLEETKGLFGKSTVRVRAEVRSAVAAAPAKSVAVESAPVEAAPAESAPVASSPAARPARGGRGGAKATPAEPVKAPVETPAAPTAEAVAEAPAKRESRRGKKPEAPQAESGVAPAGTESGPESGPEAEPQESIQATQENADQLADLLRELLASADMQVNIVVREFSGRYVTLGLDGKDAAFLVGKHGEVLNAMQYLLNIIAGRKFNNGVRATLDANDYRRRREETLTAHAIKIADQVKERGEEAVLDALPAFERRIVHKALGEISGISTYSEGEEPNRRVVIAPAD